ncbi:MAG: hypothetical protein JWQ03_1575 [Variovorax sp.]|nr:hypothetical protein [Variovorax sp.]
MSTSTRKAIVAALLGTLAGMAQVAVAQQQPSPTSEQGRVVSSTPIRQWVADANGEEQQRTVGYNVTYEFAGRRYRTQTAEPPGATIPVQVSAMGVTTPTAPASEMAAGQEDPAPWRNVTPEPGIVVPRDGVVAAYPRPVYVQPAYAAPLYVAPPVYGYGYAAPFVAPIGLSLNLGYSRGWGGGWHHR